MPTRVQACSVNPRAHMPLLSAPPAPLLQVIEMRERAFWVTHWVEDSVDCLLTGRVPIVQASGAAL